MRLRRSRLLHIGLLSVILALGLLSFRLAAGAAPHTDADLLDRFIDRKIAANGLVAAPPADDAEFLRRVSLDLTGVIPTAEEADAFLRDPHPDKRARKIEDLLKSPLYAEHWANVWSGLLIGRDRAPRVDPVRFRAWVQQAFADNMRYDRFVEALLTASGRIDENGATHYLVKFDLKPLDITASVSKLFLGLPLECAQCHDHPYESWTQRDFYGMAAFFARVRPERSKETMTRRFRLSLLGVKQKEITDKKAMRPAIFIEDRPYGEVALTVDGKEEAVPPRFIDGTGVPGRPGDNLRKAFVNRLKASETPYLSRTLVNRMWAHFFGRGLVEPLDGFVASNPPTHAELLAWLSEAFVRRDYDLKHLMRVITNSRAYQRSSRPSNAAAPDSLLARARLRPLTPEQTLYSILRATGGEVMGQQKDEEAFERMKTGLIRQFAFVFGDEEMEEDERFHGTIPRALLMMNGRLTNAGAEAAPKTNLGRILSETPDHRERVRLIFLTVLSRPPTPDEYAQTEGLRSAARGKAGLEGYEDLFWALLNTPEFAMNH